MYAGWCMSLGFHDAKKDDDHRILENQVLKIQQDAILIGSQSTNRLGIRITLTESTRLAKG
jgi:hypothetical protein